MLFQRRSILATMVGLTIAFAATAVRANEPLRVGAYPANPPWQNKMEDGSFEGFEVDIVNEIASRMGREADIAGYDFRALFVATASGRVDMVISSLTITDERLENQSFTQPYIEGALGVGVKSGSDIKSLSGLAGKRVGAIATSFGEGWLKEREGEIGYSALNSYDTVANMLTDLRAGRVDAVVNDVVGLRYAFTQSEGLEVADEIVTGERFAMMMPKDSPLLEEVNATIGEMKSDGTMAKLYERWLGTPPAEGSLTVTPLPIPTSATE
ncbi:ABC transporter substrate-binding protein [Aliiroseovarius sp. 2305UL8-7]|uniref:ABC transporter substrate-binding protein n=1 Tax=Aliiroseovarius conchicola TaxID=3121637 RepID=UPI0035275768